MCFKEFFIWFLKGHSSYREGFPLKNFELSIELTLSDLTDATRWLISVPSIYDRVYQEIWARNVAIYFRTLDMITIFISHQGSTRVPHQKGSREREPHCLYE